MSYKRVQSKFKSKNVIDKEKEVVDPEASKFLLLKYANENNFDLFKQVLKKDFGLLNEMYAYEIVKGQKNTIFAAICEDNANMEIVKFCLQNGANPYLQQGRKCSPFYFFCNSNVFFVNGRQDVLHLFLEHKNNSNCSNNNVEIKIDGFLAICKNIIPGLIDLCQLTNNNTQFKQEVISSFPKNLFNVAELFLQHNINLHSNEAVTDSLATIYKIINHYVSGSDSLKKEAWLDNENFHTSFDAIAGEGFTEKFNEEYKKIIFKISNGFIKSLIAQADINHQWNQNGKIPDNSMINREKIKILSNGDTSTIILRNVKVNEEISKKCNWIVKWQPYMFSTFKEPEMSEFEKILELDVERRCQNRHLFHF